MEIYTGKNYIVLFYTENLCKNFYKQPTKLEQHDAGIHKTVAPTAESLILCNMIPQAGNFSSFNICSKISKKTHGL